MRQVTQRRTTGLIVAGLILGLAGCASSGTARTSTPVEPATDVESPSPVVDVSQYEDFDMSQYVEAAPVSSASVIHDVPEVLMRQGAGATALRRVQGYRIQISQSLNKADAVRSEEAARAWWRSTASEGGAIGELPVYVTFQQPYYRVRLGNYADLEHAQRALAQVEMRFPGASITPDDVYVRR